MPLFRRLYRGICLASAYLSPSVQVPLDIIDDTVCNAHACSLRHGDKLMREGERVSLTVRRVERVMPRLLRL